VERVGTGEERSLPERSAAARCAVPSDSEGMDALEKTGFIFTGYTNRVFSLLK
jgi:hypothetical protein